jgi:hypothetical protein
VKWGAEERDLHAGEEVLDREDPADPNHPRGRIVPERDEDSGQEVAISSPRSTDAGCGRATIRSKGTPS